MSRKKKNFTIKLNIKPDWEIGRGHASHISGSGQHDNRPKRLRTRNAQKRQAMGDGW